MLLAVIEVDLRAIGSLARLCDRWTIVRQAVMVAEFPSDWPPPANNANAESSFLNLLYNGNTLALLLEFWPVLSWVQWISGLSA